MKNRWKLFSCLSCILFSLEGHADINVSSTQAVQQIQTYLATNPLSNNNVLQINKSALKRINTLKILSTHKIVELVRSTRPEQVSLPSLYPVHSNLLSPGKVQSRKIKTLMTVPIFIIGDDVFSKSWLTHSENKLIQLHATGFVVNVESAESLQQLQTQFPKLELMPMPGNAVAAWLKLSHYPVLVSCGTIQQ